MNGNHVTQLLAGTTLKIELGATAGTPGFAWDFLDVNGTLVITTGTLDVSSSNYAITAAGNWDNNSNFDARTGTVTSPSRGTRRGSVTCCQSPVPFVLAPLLPISHLGWRAHREVGRL